MKNSIDELPSFPKEDYYYLACSIPQSTPSQKLTLRHLARVVAYHFNIDEEEVLNSMCKPISEIIK